MLAEDEMRDLYGLINQHPEFIELNWEPAPIERVKFYEDRGCRKGDAVIAAHAEALGAEIIISENRQFLETLSGLSIKVLTARKARLRLSQPAREQ